jgi:glycosyltransferase involved in cell wall biosynthesis
VRTVITTFLVPSTEHPGGGVLGIVEFANGLARRGHEVHLVHVSFLGQGISDVEDLSWCPVDPRITHHVSGSLEPPVIGVSDFVFCFDGSVPSAGLPLTFLQAFRIFPPEIDEMILEAPGPLLCTSTWLRRLAIDHGVPAERAFHVPYGIRHEKYRLTKPIEGRPHRVAMLYNLHPVKLAELGIKAIDLAKRELPELEAVIFGTTETIQPLPGWMEHIGSPAQDVLVDDVYNDSQLFVSPALMEGFGLAAVESMACGCALVTTANGGSDDYAHHESTAMVSEPHDVETMAENIVRLVTDDQLRESIAGRGRDAALGFDWDRSASILEEILDGYGADPGAFREG